MLPKQSGGVLKSLGFKIKKFAFNVAETITNIVNGKVCFNVDAQLINNQKASANVSNFHLNINYKGNTIGTLSHDILHIQPQSAINLQSILYVDVFNLSNNIKDLYKDFKSGTSGKNALTVASNIFNELTTLKNNISFNGSMAVEGIPVNFSQNL